MSSNDSVTLSQVAHRLLKIFNAVPLDQCTSTAFPADCSSPLFLMEQKWEGKK
jgi:hypothetical protein